MKEIFRMLDKREERQRSKLAPFPDLKFIEVFLKLGNHFSIQKTKFSSIWLIVLQINQILIEILNFSLFQQYLHSKLLQSPQ